MSRLSTAIRKQVAETARYTCEYCLQPESESYFSYQIEHIIARKHGGGNERENLAYACPICNRNKGSDLGTLVGDPPELVRFFHPREDEWADHFRLDFEGVIVPLTPKGEATVKLLILNHPDAVIQRRLLIQVGILTASEGKG